MTEEKINFNEIERENIEQLVIDNSDLENNEILQIRDDRLFHDLFNRNEIATIEWVAATILKCPIEKIKGKVYTNSERLPGIRATERKKYVDLLIWYNDEFILIELNNNYSGNPMKNLMYANNLLSSYYDLEIDEDKTNIANNKIVYKKSKKVYIKPIRGILVNLNWYPPTATKRKREIPGKIVTDWNYPIDSSPEFQGYCLRILSVNLDYYANLCYDNVTEEEKFFKLLAINNKTDLKEITKDIPELENYVNKLENLSNEKEYRDMLMNERMVKKLIKEDEDFARFSMGRDVGIEQGLEKGIEQGLEKGIEKNKREMVIKMYNQNASIDFISKVSELSVEEINKIIEENI